MFHIALFRAGPIQSPPPSFKIAAESSSRTYDMRLPRKLDVLVKMRTETDPWNIAVSTVVTL